MTTAMDRVSCHIWGAGAPAKTKKDVRRVGEYFFGERSDLSRILQNK